MGSAQPSSGLVDGEHHEVVAPRSFSERLMICARDSTYDDFVRMCRPELGDAVLDVGAAEGFLGGVLGRDVSPSRGEPAGAARAVTLETAASPC